MDFCPEHPSMCEKLEKTYVNTEVTKVKVEAIDKRINGSIDDIHDHIKSGQGWRMGIMGLAGMLLIQILVFASMWGKLTNIVETNTRQVWNELTPTAKRNEINIEKILTMMEKKAFAEDKK